MSNAKTTYGNRQPKELVNKMKTTNHKYKNYALT